MYNYAGRPLAKAPGTSPDSTLDENHQRISLVIETELHDVAVLHNVVLTFLADLAVVAGLGHGAGGIKVLEGDDLGLDEALLEVGVDNACLLYTSPSPRDRG